VERLECYRQPHLRALPERGSQDELLGRVRPAPSGAKPIDGERDRRGEVACVAGAATGHPHELATQPRFGPPKQFTRGGL
jgi:hypothetical protein